jgi:HEAT repeat protein/lysophospholipase L1-like esterase
MSEAPRPVAAGTDRTGRARTRDLAVNALLAAVSVALFLGAAEMIARIAEPPAAPPPADYITDWQSWDGDFYTVKSTAVGWPPWEDYNTEGLRDREHTTQKRPGTWRIACLGDSVTLGWGILPQQAYPQVLEELAEARGLDLDVMNVALGGWSPRQELIAYRRIARRYRPDQVLVGICLNDVAEMQNNLSRPPALLAELHRRSALVRRIVRAREREIGAVEELFSSPGAPQVREGYQRMFADLRTLRSEVRADGARFAILVFPFRFQVAPGAPPPLAQRTIEAFCKSEGIPFLDLLPALAVLGEPAFHDYDHFSPAGARLVAEHVLESGLLVPFSGDARDNVPFSRDARDNVPFSRDARDIPSTAESSPGESAAAGVAGSSPGSQPAHGHDWHALTAALRDADEGRRAAAARALASLGEEAAPAVPALVAALDDSSRVVRAAVAWALGDVGAAAAPAVPHLCRLLQEADPFVRSGAAYGLGGIGSAAKPGVPPLVARLGDPDERVRWRAGDALAKIGIEAGSVEPLVRLVRDEGGPGRGLAAEALGRLGPAAHASVPDLMAAVSDPRTDVRWRAVWAIGRIGPAAGGAVPTLRAALADPDVRWRAAEALGGIGSGAVGAVPDLVALLGDPSSNVRWRAATALGAIGARDAAPALAKAVRDPAENVRLAAIEGLIQLRAERAVAEAAFLSALGDADSRVRLHAVRGLDHLGVPSRAARRALEAAGRDPDESVRTEAAKVLRRRGR